ncbi:MAG: peptide chain release factor N(5)-glutamine methyltransferase [Endozoicomonadaceae bacterium]|nr:peptide chain release factor N(5)-glutamine methyltransferase [Endozoicomonadaceae bacterium]
MTVLEWLFQAKKQLTSHTAELEARLLLAYTLNCSSETLLTWPEKSLSVSQQDKANHLLDKRVHGEPIAYLLNERFFWSQRLKVDQNVLIPRPETELLIEQAIETWPDTPKIMLDLGTGSGAIAIALATERPSWQIIGSDINNNSLAIAKQNAQRHACHSIQWKQSDWFHHLSGYLFDIIISNPPYLSTQDPHLINSDLTFEPYEALVSGPTGYEALYSIIEEAPNYLKQGGYLMLEHGSEQGFNVRTKLKQFGFTAITTSLDLQHLDRTTQGFWVQ